MTAGTQPSEVPMKIPLTTAIDRRIFRWKIPRRYHLIVPSLTHILFVPVVAFAQADGSPFDTGFTALQTLFTGTVAKVASLIAIVIGGYGFALPTENPAQRKVPTANAAWMNRDKHR